jgi:hypothetical protein
MYYYGLQINWGLSNKKIAAKKFLPSRFLATDKDDKMVLRITSLK